MMSGIRWPVLVLSLLMLSVSLGGSLVRVRAQGGLSPNATVLATGLDNPRGLKFGPDGFLYVAEGGTGGSTSTAGECTQVIPPVGPYTSGNTARISKISPDGVRTTVVEGLPSSQTSPMLGNLVSGVASVEFIGDTLYALLAGAGCSHGVSDVPNAVIRVNPDGTTTPIADLSAFQMTHPVQNPESDDFEPDGTWYSMVRVGSDLYAIEPNHGELDKITLSGEVTRVADISATLHHVVPTSVAVGPDGNFYVGNLTELPYVDQTARIAKITPDGNLSIFACGLTTVLGVAFDSQGRLYVLENSTGNTSQPPFLVPGSGKVLRLTDSCSFETVASGLTFPTAMTFGPDGNLYVSNVGFGAGPGEGQIVKINVDLP